MSRPAQHPRDVALQWAERVWNAARVSEVAPLIHDDHPIGARAVIASFQRLHEKLKGLEASVEHQVVEGERVVTFLKLSAIANGEPIGWEAVYLHTIRDGKIASYVSVSSIPPEL